MDYCPDDLAVNGGEGARNGRDGELGSIYTKQTEIDATVDIKPNTLNMANSSGIVRAYIELPQGFDVSDINPETLYL
ncbi:MAG: hypothetical protein GY765_06940, partial [bacterium]|nr:hypothetical protein [bacterium]